MALKIIDECIACDACTEVCPSGAIEGADPIYIISFDLCTQCVGYFDDPEPSCVKVCPVDAIILDESKLETDIQLMEKYIKNNT